LGEGSAAGPREKIGDDQATLDELAKIAASLAKTAEEQNRHIAAHDRQIASLLTAVESHDRQITSLAGSIESHDRQIAR
jgi:ABC-type Fe3+-citrate transport system substrate-binding protein